jgi:hypothetical protein
MEPATNVGMSFTRSNVTTFEDPTLPAGTVLRSTSTTTESISGNEWFGDYYKKYGSFFSGADIRSMTWDRSRFWDLSVTTESGIVTVGTGMTREEQRLLAEAQSLFSPSFFADPINYIGGGSAVGAGVARGLRFNMGIHGPHHYFPSLGRSAPHFQVNIWKSGVKGSDESYHVPLPTRLWNWWNSLWE